MTPQPRLSWKMLQALAEGVLETGHGVELWLHADRNGTARPADLALTATQVLELYRKEGRKRGKVIVC